ncbi:ATP-dependent helicase [Streptomyces sp. NBRC 110611]|uniref:hypothetical protein n=1 Tax=Streptomyces sp. NBRC 110611 TaxID=1621259 RepID=UPI000855ECA0|nr:hypothetical protein [Streptomyces sp. NBRC 110611]GAU69428.1 ATP-dependent helicase [Streptomyces sp. NBRC 110611]
MKDEFSASVCCSWDAVRIIAEKGVPGPAGAGAPDGVGLDELGAAKADLRGPGWGSPLLMGSPLLERS